jgi:hypothetical protein
MKALFLPSESGKINNEKLPTLEKEHVLVIIARSNNISLLGKIEFLVAPNHCGAKKGFKKIQACNKNLNEKNVS